MSLREKIFSLFKTSAKTSKEITYFTVLLFSVLTLPVIIAAAAQPFYKRSQAIDPCPKITTTSLPGGIVGKEYGASVDAIHYASNSPLTMEFSSLPPGLSKGKCAMSYLGGSTTISCGITGTPIKAGGFTITVTVRDGGCKVSRLFPLKITSSPVPPITPQPTSPVTPYPLPTASPTPQPTSPVTPYPLPTASAILNHPPKITTASLPNGTMGRRYEATVTAEDIDGDSLTMKIYNLSYYLSGLSLNPSSCRSIQTPSFTRLNCLIEGYFNHPNAAKHSPYRIQLIAKDSRGAQTTKYLQLIVRAR